VVPGLAASAAIFVPGSGHLIARDLQGALFFSSALGFVTALGWALWQTLDRLLPTLALLEVASWSLAVIFAMLYLLAAALHVLNVLDAHAARLRACLPRRAHPILAALASAVVPGWGQVLAGKRGRAALFLSALWALGAAWLLALAPIRETLGRLGLPLPLDDRLIDHYGPIVLLAATGVVWTIATWDAAATRPDRR
jgi:hypothetical protein